MKRILEKISHSLSAIKATAVFITVVYKARKRAENRDLETLK